MLSLLTTEKSFDNRWVGHRGWNERFALHRRRMLSAERAVAVRRLSAFLFRSRPAAAKALDHQGYAVIPNFLPGDLFRQVSAEAETAVAAAALSHPITSNDEPGFGDKNPFPGGFDRWDGGTLNRFIRIDTAAMPAARRAARVPGLSGVARQVLGLPHAPGKTLVYLTVHGDEAVNPDLQREFHRDTFFSAMKFWLFLRPVSASEGPFTYVPGSHRLTPARMAWEEAEAHRIVASDGSDRNTGGSFRIDRRRFRAMGLPDPVACSCHANTLVVANTLGFHARGHATPGSQRLALYGWRRPFPFGLLGR